MADEIRRMQDYTASDINDNIAEVREARGTYESLDARLDNIEDGSPSPSSDTPAMDGTGAAGTADTYARSDHVHPTDTSRQAKLTTAQLAAVNSGITSTDVEQIETNKNNILLIEQLNGRYNLAETNNATFTRDTYISCALKANTSYYLRIKSFTSEATGVQSQILFYEGSQQKGAIEGSRFISHGDDVSVVFTPNSAIDSIRLYSANDGAASDNKSATFTNLCIIEKTVYDSGLTQYVPYSMSNAGLTAELMSITYTAPTGSTQYGVTILSGGYFKIGKLCVVNVRITNTNAIPNNTYFLYDLPEAVIAEGVTAGSSICALSNTKNVYLPVTTQGNVLNASGAQINAGETIVLSGCYLCK